MKFGICTGLENITKIQNLGIDYFESSVVGMNALHEDEFNSFLAEHKQSSIKCEALNCLFPSTMQLVGPKVDINEMKSYLEQSFARAGQVQVQVVVFGSGRSRFCPDGFSFDKAMEQMCEFAYLAGEVAKRYGLTIALEPLNTNETNLINTVEQGLELVERVSHPNFMLLADIYHMLINDEKPDSLLTCKGSLIHTHIATKEGRRFPLSTSQDHFQDFFQALNAIGYEARMSIEGATDDLESDTKAAMECLHILKSNTK